MPKYEIKIALEMDEPLDVTKIDSYHAEITVATPLGGAVWMAKQPVNSMHWYATEVK